LFASSTRYANTKGVTVEENGLLDFSKYKDVYVYLILNDLSKMKNRFGADEVVIACDTGPYWRKTGAGDHSGYSRYKYGRGKDDDKNVIDWAASKNAQNELIDVLKENSTFKVIAKRSIEGDDTLFVLAEELSKRGHEVVCKSLDHDIYYTLEHENVQYWQTKHTTQNKKCGFVEMTPKEIQEEKYYHILLGDPGDGFLHSKSWTVFSDEFLSLYPGKTPLQVWAKRHEIDIAFQAKHKDDFPDVKNLSAWKHPKFGRKTFQKKLDSGKITLESFLAENPIHQLNYNLNETLAMPYKIPKEIRQCIIDEYNETPCDLKPLGLNEYFNANSLFSLFGKAGLF